MERMVIVKYLGIKIGIKPDGTPRLLPRYSCGSQLDMAIGGYSDPIPMSEALRLKNDFGSDAFEIVVEADLPTTPEEADEIERAIESGDALTVSDNLLPPHISQEEVKVQEAKIIASEPDGIQVVRVARKQPFDKTVEPVRYTKSALGRMSKPKLIGIFKALVASGTQGIVKYDKSMTRQDLIGKILEMQG